MGLLDIFRRGNKPMTVENGNRLDEYVLRQIAGAIYPDYKWETYLKSYTQNGDVFTVINKIIEPASGVPIKQFDASDNEVPSGKMLQLINNPNPYMSRGELIEAVLSFYLIFGNSYTAFQSIENGINANTPLRLDLLPPQWMQMVLGTYLDPIAGWKFIQSGSVTDYAKEQVLHWKEFNPDYDSQGSGHLYGMSRLKPILKSVIGSGSGYDSLVAAFQHQGAFGLLTILGEEGSTQAVSKTQLSAIKNQYKEEYTGSANAGKIVVTSKDHKWTNFGMSVVELNVLAAIGTFGGKIYDAYNVPSVLMSGSTDKTYTNFGEAKKALWSDAIIPSLDAYLDKLSRWLAPYFKEQGHRLAADYSGIDVLQKNKTELIAWMVNARSFTRNEIREAAGYDLLPLPGMDEVFDTAGLLPVGALGMTPEAPLTEEVMKALHINDYRIKN
jgi:HK97 family phage portal protein